MSNRTRGNDVHQVKDKAYAEKFITDIAVMVREELNQFRATLREDYKATNDRITKVDDASQKRWSDHLKSYHEESGALKAWGRAASAFAGVAVIMASWALFEITQHGQSIATLTAQQMALAQTVGSLQAQKNTTIETPSWMANPPIWLRRVEGAMKGATTALNNAAKKLEKASVAQKPPSADSTKRFTDYYSRKGFRPGEIN